MDGWVRLLTESQSFRAELLKNALEGVGIPAVLLNQKDSSYGFGEFALWVPGNEVERAQIELGLHLGSELPTGALGSDESERTQFEPDEHGVEAPLNDDERSRQGGRDILYGALWMAGGTALTLADTGYIWLGAIFFGGYKMLSGIVRQS